MNTQRKFINNTPHIFQRKRLYGEFLIGKKALPPLSKTSVDSIEAGIPDYHSIFRDVRSHIMDVTKAGLDIKRFELNNVAEALVNCYKTLADVDDPKMKSYVGSENISTAITYTETRINKSKMTTSIFFFLEWLERQTQCFH